MDGDFLIFVLDSIYRANNGVLHNRIGPGRPLGYLSEGVESYPWLQVGVPVVLHFSDEHF